MFLSSSMLAADGGEPDRTTREVRVCMDESSARAGSVAIGNRRACEQVADAFVSRTFERLGVPEGHNITIDDVLRYFFTRSVRAHASRP
jgi:hypothetical protein